MAEAIEKLSAIERPATGMLYALRLSAFFLVCFIVIMYLTFAPMVNRHFYNNRVLFQPVRCTILKHEWAGRTAQEICFKNAGGRALSALYLPSEQARHVILIHHGQHGNINNHLALCSFLIRPENSIFIYDYSGFGKSEGSPTIAGMIDDARAAYKCMVEQLHIDESKIVQYGGSLGTGPAALIAAEKPGAGLVLLSPYTSLKAAARDTFPFFKIYPDFLLTDTDFDTIANVRRIKAPLLIAHGTNDSCINVRHGDAIYAAANDPKIYLRQQNGGHFINDSRDTQKAILLFIEQLR